MNDDPTPHTFIRVAKGLGVALGLLAVAAPVVFAFPAQAHHLALVLALGLVGWGARGLYPYFRARRWPQTVATLERLEETWVTIPTGGSYVPRYFYPLAEYRYTVGDTPYASTRVSFERENLWRGETEPRDWQRWGTTIPIYYDPAQPGSAVICRTLSKRRRAHHVSVIAAGFVCLALWLGLLHIN
ncbi:DUF3592 domain-containing protein [Ectothiorhodospiraceae bacterium 2226]|nr:DUF3592 domain-containing protein [Ectothiorhodospiraceae bacterium 2226]